jgi:hypothetical protein
VSQNSKRIRIRILGHTSGCGHTSLAHARRYVRRGLAEWIDDTAIRFPPRSKARPAALDPREAPDFKPADSGFSTARYPLSMLTTSGDRFPGLVRVGAGLG